MVLSCCQVTIDALRCCINIVQTVGSMIELGLQTIHQLLLCGKLPRYTSLPSGGIRIRRNAGRIVGVCAGQGPCYTLCLILQGSQLGLCFIQLAAQLADALGEGQALITVLLKLFFQTFNFLCRAGKVLFKIAVIQLCAVCNIAIRSRHFASPHFFPSHAFITASSASVKLVFRSTSSRFSWYHC